MKLRPIHHLRKRSNIDLQHVAEELQTLQKSGVCPDKIDEIAESVMFFEETMKEKVRKAMK